MVSSLKLYIGQRWHTAIARISSLARDYRDTNDFQEVVKSLLGKETLQNKFNGIQRVSKSPNACQFIIANPSKFLKQPSLLSQYNIKTHNQSEDALNDYLASVLPVIYIADRHMEYGTLGYVLNRKSAGATMNDISPNFRHLRHRPIYEGGPANSGSSFTMIHRKVGFPENRLATVTAFFSTFSYSSFMSLSAM